MNAYKNKIRIQKITYAIVIGCYILIQIMMAGGHVNSLLKGYSGSTLYLYDFGGFLKPHGWYPR